MRDKGRGDIKAPGYRRDLDLRLQPRIIAGVGEEGRKTDRRANLGGIRCEKRKATERRDDARSKRSTANTPTGGDSGAESKNPAASGGGRVVGESRRGRATPGKETERERARTRGEEKEGEGGGGKADSSGCAQRFDPKNKFGTANACYSVMIGLEQAGPRGPQVIRPITAAPPRVSTNGNDSFLVWYLLAGR
ncbi:hypothetical protein GW17_00048951 [Ensete ventricosum]|nr:hypothetical protein GW17_00048951 [Ensete ventricosum]